LSALSRATTRASARERGRLVVAFCLSPSRHAFRPASSMSLATRWIAICAATAQQYGPFSSFWTPLCPM
jgi:hypothetical protein